MGLSKDMHNNIICMSIKLVVAGLIGIIILYNNLYHFHFNIQANNYFFFQIPKF